MTPVRTLIFHQTHAETKTGGIFHADECILDRNTPKTAHLTQFCSDYESK